MKTIAALVAAVALLGQSSQALTPINQEVERFTLQGDPTVNTTGTDGAVNVGDDDGTELISPLVPETATGVSLLGDMSANSVPWTFKLAAQQSAPGRELVAALSPLPTARECPAFARTARNVLIAVSSCFTKTTYTQIDEWVKSLKKNDIRYFPDDANAVGYEVRWVHDGCAKPDWSNLELKCDSDGDYVGVISITVYKKAADTVAQFIAGKNLPPPIGYVYNGPTSLKVKNSNTAVVTAASTKVRTSYDGYKVVEWNDVDKGFMCHTDLLENLRKVHCATLPGSKASLFVSGSTRKCFCSCADDSEFVGNECKPKPKDEDCTCLWSTSKNGYTFDVKTSGSVCSVANAGTLPVPIIGDNYVDRFRANNGDFVNPLTSPRITLIKERNAVTLSGHGKRTQDTGALVSTPYTWKDFQSATNSPVNSLVFDQLGQYKIELQAFDYNSNATCPGCVLVVDSFRPTHHSNYPCPAPLTDTVAEFSSAAVAKYREAVQRFKNFSAFALNDGCSLDSRCDAETKRTKAFVEGYYGSSVPSADGSAAFFDEAVVKADLKAKLSGGSVAASGEVTKCSASTSGSVAGCVEDICMRCIDVSSELKEWWVDYKCGSTVANAKCEGKEPACVLKQCLTVNATSIFTGSAQLKETVRNASLAVLKAKEENKNKTDTAIAFEFQMGSTVHIALVKCTDFNASDPNCVYSTKISDLIDTSVSKVAGGLFTDDEVKGFVTWRYSVDNVNWKPLTTTTLETFTQAKKEIKVEAWSKCGLVNKFSFNVALHLNNKIEVCDKFPSMWYQTTTPTTVLLDKTSEVCMHPKSDFAEVTFDYKPNIGLRTGTLEMTISGVSCTIKYADSTGNATIVSVTKAPYEIIKEFAIDGVKFQTTDAVTKVEVACTFTYTRTLDKATESQVCSRSLVIKDCTPPTITKPCPFQDKCDFSKCAKARKGQPDIYQACAGNRISQTSTGAATITTANATCCESCAGSDYTTLCRPLRASPSGATSDGLFIGRCDAEKTTTTTTTTGSYTTPSSPYASAYSQYAPLAMLQAAANGSISAPGAASSALLGASALVAVVALVVVARRRARAELAVVEEDAYYPLMG